jgi:hypothetical protein
VLCEAACRADGADIRDVHRVLFGFDPAEAPIRRQLGLGKHELPTERMAPGGLAGQFLPRLPGLAERVWTAGTARDWDDLRARLAAQASAWRRHGHVWFPAPSIDWA